MNITDEQRKILDEYSIPFPKNDEVNELLLDIDEKLTAIGFDRDYELTEIGFKLQRLYDQIYIQNCKRNR